MWQTIRKFGLQYCDLPTMIWNVSQMLRLLTLNIDRRNKNKIPIVFYLWTAYTVSTYVYVYNFSMLWFVFVYCVNNGHVFDAIIVFSLGICGFMGFTKYIFMLLYQHSIRDLVDEYLACDSSVAPGSRFSRNLLQVCRVVKKRAIIYWTVVIGNGVAYLLQAVVKPGRHMMEDCFVFYGFDSMFESPQYELAYLINMGGLITTCYLPANITALFIIFVGYTEGQLLALSKELRHLWSDAKQHSKNRTQNIEDNNGAIRRMIENEYVKNELEFIVKTHTNSIVLLRKLEKLLQKVNVVELLILLITLTVILLGGLENTYIQLPFALIMVGMDCLMGQRLLDASLVFETAVYECGWENFDLRNMKTVLLVLINAQKGLQLSAGGLQQLSYDCANKVVRFIYSAYTALRTVMK